MYPLVGAASNGFAAVGGSEGGEMEEEVEEAGEEAVQEV
jgi:hypothetical protein